MLKRFLAVAALGALTIGLTALPATSAAGPAPATAMAAFAATSPAPATTAARTAASTPSAHGTARATAKPGGERYLHVKVEDSENGESVNVNLPLSMAEKIIPAVNHGDLHNGRVKIHDADIDGVDIRAMLDALRTAEDNEFVTVKQRDEEVRVAKSKGNLVIHIVDNSERGKDKDAEKDADRQSGKDNKDAKKSYKVKMHGQKVEVTVPMKVVDALISTTKDNELDIAAALRALADAGDAVLVTVQDASQHIRVWVDSRSGQE